MRFRDRTDAGRRLAERLAGIGLDGAVVLGLPRGGVPVAAEVASALGGPLDVLVARKVGAPGQPEYGIGAIAEGGATVTAASAVEAFGVAPPALDALVAAEQRELERRVQAYRGRRPLPDLGGRAVVVVDDGLATGVTARAALLAVRAAAPARLVLAVPVAAPTTAAALRGPADEVVAVIEPTPFLAVGAWYDDFTQTTDEEVRSLLPPPW